MSNHELYSVSEKLITFLMHLNKHLFNHNDIFKGLSIPPSHAKVIFYLNHVGSAPVSQIGKDLAISKPNMTPIIDKLLSEGLVNRYYDQNDRRVIRVEINDKARELFKGHQEFMKAQVSNKLSALEEDDVETLNECLTKMYDICAKLKQ